MASFFKTVFVFKLGVIAGFIAAHLVNQTPQGRAFFANVNAKVRDFTESVSAGYREREAELRNSTD
ncbi:MAG TPA: hypothetical protein VK139_02455 [Microbacteriaceae bacterium]|nr:hypothetical protein [Microbacteriaceae bacterium]